MPEVYINRISIFLPNNAVSNDEMENYLGLINGKPSKSRRIILRNNGIESRYYALDSTGNPTHSNADLAASAIRALFKDTPEELADLELLCCGTSSPDQLVPSHGCMVHGLLPQTGNIEVTSNAGSCASGMHALKFAYLALKSGDKTNAVCSGSERVSTILKSDGFEDEVKHLEAFAENQYIAFEKDFLRWMLSDGAGAFLLGNKPNTEGLSLRIDWIELSSFANEKESCMYMGAEKQADGSLKSYNNFTPQDIAKKSILSVKQDVKLLSENIVELGFTHLKTILDKKGIRGEEIDYLLPHMSSFFFKDRIDNILKSNGINIPYDRWFTNLKTRGNVGSGSIYLMLEELFMNGTLKKGQKILLAVPESARFSYAFCLLTVC